MSICAGEFPTYIGTSKNISREEVEKLKQINLPIFFYDDNCKIINNENINHGRSNNT